MFNVAVTQLSKIQIQKAVKNTEFDTEENVLLYLQKIQEKEGLQIFSLLDILCKGKINTVSFSRDTPYQYFYARLGREFISIRLRKTGEEIGVKIKSKSLRTSPLLV